MPEMCRGCFQIWCFLVAGSGKKASEAERDGWKSALPLTIKLTIYAIESSKQ